MKSFIRNSIITSIFLILLANPVNAGWKAKVTQNQLKAREYISKLKNRANPDKITRPQIRRIDNWKGKQSQKEIVAAMNRAEALARSGRQSLITKPIFKFNGLSTTNIPKNK